jgi:hypothetical protein
VLETDGSVPSFSPNAWTAPCCASLQQCHAHKTCSWIGPVIIFTVLTDVPNHESCTDFFVHKRIIAAVKRVEFVSDRMSYINTKRSLVSYHCSERSCPNRG